MACTTFANGLVLTLVLTSLASAAANNGQQPTCASVVADQIPLNRTALAPIAAANYPASRLVPFLNYVQFSSPHFAISLYHEGNLRNARYFAAANLTAPNPIILYVSTFRDNVNKVYAVVDLNRDEEVDYAYTIIDDAPNCNGIVYLDGSLYVATFRSDTTTGYLQGVIERYDGIDTFAAAGRSYAGTPVILTTALPPTRSTPLGVNLDHQWRVLAINDGKLYIPIGEPQLCLATAPRSDKTLCPQVYYKSPEEPNVTDSRYLPYSSIVRMSLQPGSPLEVVATGVRNSVGFHFSKEGALWFVDHGRDQLANDAPDDELNCLDPTNTPKFYGFSKCFSSGYGRPDCRQPGLSFTCNEPLDNDPSYNCADPINVKPKQALGPHVAPLGMITYKHDPNAPNSWGPEFDGTMLLALRGSWNRNLHIGYSIQQIKLVKEGTGRCGYRVEEYRPFAKGWIQPPSANKYGLNFTDAQTDDAGNFIWGRPNDLIQLPSGSVLLTDPHNGVIYKISRRKPSRS